MLLSTRFKVLVYHHKAVKMYNFFFYFLPGMIMNTFCLIPANVFFHSSNERTLHLSLVNQQHSGTGFSWMINWCRSKHLWDHRPGLGTWFPYQQVNWLSSILAKSEFESLCEQCAFHHENIVICNLHHVLSEGEEMQLGLFTNVIQLTGSLV